MNRCDYPNRFSQRIVFNFCRSVHSENRRKQVLYFQLFLDKYCFCKLSSCSPLCMDFVVLRAIYRSRVQLLKVIYFQFCIKSIIYKYISIQYRAQRLKTFLPFWVAVLQMFVVYTEKHPKIIRLICTFRRVPFSISI